RSCRQPQIWMAAIFVDGAPPMGGEIIRAVAPDRRGLAPIDQLFGRAWRSWPDVSGEQERGPRLWPDLPPRLEAGEGEPPPRADRSFAAFWLPFQDVNTHNHTAQWVETVPAPLPPINPPPIIP